MPQRLFLLIAWFTTVVALFSCGSKATSSSAECAGVHYCINALLNEQLDAYSTNQPMLSKYVYLNGQQETKNIQLDRVRWEAEFTAFREADIDKPALQGKYLVDTLFVDTDSLTRISYIAQDPALRTRYMHLYFKPDQQVPAYIEARLETKNVFYQSVQELEFVPGEYYSIKGFQDIWLLGEDTFSVKSTFILE